MGADPWKHWGEDRRHDRADRFWHWTPRFLEAAEGAEAVVIATEWEQFRALDLDRLRSVMARPVIVDLRNIYRAEEMKRANFRYLAVGRPAAERKA